MRRRLATLVIALGLLSGSCIYARMFYYNVPNLDAPRYFDSRTVRASPAPLPLEKSDVEDAPVLGDVERATYGSFDALLERNETRAFLELRDDTIVYERYFGGVTATTALPSFSISKTFAALLVGC